MVVLLLVGRVSTATVSAASVQQARVPVSCSPSTTSQGQSVGCAVSYQSPAGVIISAITWSWGDGTASAGLAAPHAYVSLGTYRLTVTVLFSNWRTGVDTTAVTVLGYSSAPAPASVASPAFASTPRPDTPNNLRATAIDAHQIRLDWTDPGPYQDGIVVSGDSGGIATLPAHTKTYVLTGLQPGTQYCVSVYAFGPGGDSLPSNRACATTSNQAQQLPAVPTSLTATPLDSASILLAWTPGSNDADGYAIVDVATGNVVVQVDAGATSFTLQGLDAGATYCSQVYAYNAAGNSDFTDQACATTAR